jgi:hypothetical protein
MKKIDCHLINASICLSDLQAPKLKIATNGKIYLNFSIGVRKEVDQFGNDLTMSYTKTKEEREAKAETFYVSGNAKQVTFTGDPEPEFTDQPPSEEDLKKLCA